MEEKNSSLEMEYFQNAPCGFFSTKSDGTIIIINDTLLNWLGYTKTEIVGKVKWSDLLSVGGKIYNQTHFTPLTYIQDFIQEINFDFVKANGEKIPVLINAKPIKDELGKLASLNVIVIQFTQRKSYEQEIIKAKEIANIANRAKSNFLSNMSHEIRNPLNAVIGFSDLLLKSQINEIQRQYLGIIFQSANSLLDILNDVLDISKIEAGKLEINIEPVEINELAEHAIDIIKYKAHTKNVEILFNLPQNLPKIIYLDPIRFRQIILNLLSNAAKFTEHGEIEFKIEFTENPNNKIGNLLVSIRDSGIGISEENKDKIFEAFSQADSSITRKFGGTGLGLTISNQLLALMDSKLELNSKYGEGSTFYFNLPVRFEKNKTNNIFTFEKLKKIFILDDNKNNLKILEKMFLGSDDVESFFNPTEVINKIKTNKPDLFIVDYRMPDLNGIEVIRKIRNELTLSENDLPILLLYNSTDSEVILKEESNLKINARILKPVKKNELFNTLYKIEENFNSNSIKNLDIPNLSPSIIIKDQIKIMFADDDEINIYLAKSICNIIFSNVIFIEATNGLDAIDKYKQEKPNIIFMDIQMPEMNGFEATKEIRKIDSVVPIIAFTAGAMKEDIDLCYQAGMSDYTPKPTTKAELERVIRKWVDFSK